MYTLKEMAAMLGLRGTANLRMAIKRGVLQARLMGTTYVVEHREIERYRAEHLGRQGGKRLPTDDR